MLDNKRMSLIATPNQTTAILKYLHAHGHDRADTVAVYKVDYFDSGIIEYNLVNSPMPQ
jgi:hypothetical protein